MKKILFVLLASGVVMSIALLSIKYTCEKYEREQIEWEKNLQHSVSKNVKILEDAISNSSDASNRTIAIYLPDGYEADTISYPIFYFLDGQSIYDNKILVGDEWQVDEVLDSLGKMNRKAIAVGIYNSANRDSEYQPNFKSETFDPRFTGDLHSEWIINEVKPWIDQTYRTKKDASSTVIGGSSFGGLMAYHMLTEYPDIFGGAIVLSPSFWVNEKSLLLDQKVKDMTDQIIFLSAGEEERGIMKGTRQLDKILRQRGINENYRFVIEKDEIHRNLAWRKMIRKSIPWVLDRMEGQFKTPQGSCG